MTGLVLGAGLTAAVMLLTGNDGHSSEATLSSSGTRADAGGSDSIGAGEAGIASGATPTTAPATTPGAAPASPATGSGGGGHGTTAAGVARPDTAAVPGDLTSGARQSRASVVRVAANRGGVALAGYGVELPTPGIVLTADSLIDEVDEVSVTDSGGNRLMATVVGTDPVTDVGVLRVQTTSWLPIAISTAQPWDTEVVSAMTYPSQVYLGQINSTWSNVDVPGRPPMLGSLAADLPMPADSLGTPLLNQAGQLVGMVGAISSGQAPVLAVSSATAEAAVESLLATGSVPHGWIGVEQAAAVHDGVRLVQVDANSPAGQAGLADGDVITAVDGRTLDSVDDLWAAVRLRQPGSHVAVSRIDTTHHSSTVQVTLGSMKAH
jgi:putative serine protease PepD